MHATAAETTPAARPDPFAPATQAADLLELRAVYASFLAGLRPDDWTRRTGPRAKDWTVRETVAHLDSVLSTYRKGVAAALAGRSLEVPSVLRREDLSRWNRAEIDARAGMGAEELGAQLLEGMAELARTAGALSAEESRRTAALPFFNAPMRACDMIGSQLVHTGIIHAAQVVRGTGAAPLWRALRPATVQRMLAHFVRVMGFVYWPERGGNLRATIAIVVDGPHGGAWHVAIGPAGGVGLAGPAERADLTFRLRSPDSACRVFALDLELPRALLGRHLRLSGDLGLAARFPVLFTPT
ncbi:MAG TPA: maleylpyruvate isomerase N-terminal domain-containing protein [Roseiflexaceae bacterium]|nr:maleylpyruvate isomerase N-terminal domain-containing protein [Roseiflexaceae bacterium]